MTYLWADAIHVNVRMEEPKLCLLAMIGVRAAAAGTGRSDRGTGIDRVPGGPAA